MIFYLLLIITFVMDIINLNISKNHKDKFKYIVAMTCVAIIGIVFIKYNDNVQISQNVLEFFGILGGE